MSQLVLLFAANLAVAAAFISVAVGVVRALRSAKGSGVRVKVGSNAFEVGAHTTPEEFELRLEEALANGKAPASAR